MEAKKNIKELLERYNSQVEENTTDAGEFMAKGDCCDLCCDINNCCQRWCIICT